MAVRMDRGNRKASAPTSLSKARVGQRKIAVAVALGAVMVGGTAFGGDMAWDNGGGNLAWDLSTPNWSGSIWDNGGAGAVFGIDYPDTINVGGNVTVRSLSFDGNPYVLSGSGSLTLTASSSGAASTYSGGQLHATEGTVAKIDLPISGTTALQKVGAGTIELSKPVNVTGTTPISAVTSLYSVHVMVGRSVFDPLGGASQSGTLRLMNSSVLPATTKVGISNGFLDIGANDVTIQSLHFANQNSNYIWNTELNATNGVVGTGKLRVTGEITVYGINLSPGGNGGGNTIAAPLDLGGGTQILRVGRGSSVDVGNALMITGSISNGSLTKTLGNIFTGSVAGIGGLSLYGDNTYTGPTRLNGSSNIIGGTNASQFVQVVNGTLTLIGPKGSLLGASEVSIQSGGQLILDNNASQTGTLATPPITATLNGNRLADDGVLTLRDSSLTFRGNAGIASSETIGKLNIAGGHSTITTTANAVTNGGTAVLVINTFAYTPTSTVALTVSGTSNTLAGTNQVLVTHGNGLPSAVGGILPRIVASAGDFVTYNSSTGLTPLASSSYSGAIAAGANVWLSGATTHTGALTINSLKTTGTFGTTIAATGTLSIATGMIFSASGTQTFTGPGMIDFGSTPGAIFGTVNVSAAMTGSAGLINSSGTLSLGGDMSGLGGGITINSGTVNLRTTTFTGPVHVRTGTLAVGVSQTGTGYGAITLGVAENSSDLIAATPTLDFSTMGANGVLKQDIIVNNGGANGAGMGISYSFAAKLTPLTNNTAGTQTLSGSVTLNSPLNLQGGGGTGTGATMFSGAISGSETFFIPNGRVIFSPTSTLAGTFGFEMGGTGFTLKAHFLGTSTSTGPIRVSGGNNTSVTYSPGSLPTGLFTIHSSSGTTAPTLIPTATSTLTNPIQLDGDVVVHADAGITATYSGTLAGVGAMKKSGTGSMVISGNASTYGGAINVVAGSMSFNPSASASSSAYHRIAAPSSLTVGVVGSSEVSRLTVMPTNRLGSGARLASVLVTGSVSIASSSGHIDLGNNDLIVTGSTESAISGLVKSWWNSGQRNGLGLGSSISAAGVGVEALTTLAVVGNSNGQGGVRWSKFDGVTGLDADDVIVKYTWIGDTDLSGRVDATDIQQTVAGLRSGATGWYNGDNNYDGVVNGDDLANLLRAFYLQGSSLGDGSGGVSTGGGVVPEPSGLVGLAMVGLGLCTRRRR